MRQGDGCKFRRYKRVVQQEWIVACEMDRTGPLAFLVEYAVHSGKRGFQAGVEGCGGGGIDEKGGGLGGEVEDSGLD